MSVGGFPVSSIFMARNLPPGEERSAFLQMAEEWDRLADQLEHQTPPSRQEKPAAACVLITTLGGTNRPSPHRRADEP
jgi:hypothetical protein